MLIRPCAYCWGDRVHLSKSPIHLDWYVFCDEANNCFAVGGHAPTKEEAVRAWNSVTDAVKVRLSPHSEEYVRACRQEDTTP